MGRTTLNHRFDPVSKMVAFAKDLNKQRIEVS
jgi:hypothetical protein